MNSLLKYFDRENPNERCGLILKGGKIIEVNNTSNNPEQSFEIDPAALIEHDDNIEATWHTHPNTKSNLSEKDYAGFLAWPHLKHYIIGVDGVSSFIVKDGIVLNAD